MLLQNYVRQMGWNEYRTYCDDGYSGTNFNRPAVKQLIEDAKAKRINLILVKDYCAIIGLNQKDLENQGILA